MRVIGQAKKGQIEQRYVDDTRYPDADDHLDEIVARDAFVHLEKMGDKGFALIVHGKRETACIMIGAKRAKVDAWVAWREPRQRQSTTQAKRASSTRRSEAK